MKNKSSQYLRDGYLVVPNFFSSELADKLRNEILTYLSKVPNKYGVWNFPERYLRIIDPRFYRNSPEVFFDLNFYLTILNSLQIESLKLLIKDLKFEKINRIDTYLTAISDKDILKWHADQAYGGAVDPGNYFNHNMSKDSISIKPVNKVFVHLTDVEVNNGCFSYMPASHNIGIAIRKIINSGILEYTPFYELKDGYSIVECHYNKFIENGLLTADEMKYFLDQAGLALDGSLDYRIPCEAGSMVLFNDLGYHQGTAPLASERLVLRYWYY